MKDTGGTAYWRISKQGYSDSVPKNTLEIIDRHEIRECAILPAYSGQFLFTKAFISIGLLHEEGNGSKQETICERLVARNYF